MKTNIKNLSFLIASYSEMIKTFGYSDKTNKFFLEQICGLKNISQISSQDIFYVGKITGIYPKAMGYSKEELMKRINDFNETMNYMLSVDKTEYIQQFYSLYYSSKYGVDVLQIVSDIFEVDVKTKPKTVSTSIKFGSFDVKNNDYSTGNLDKLRDFIKDNLDENTLLYADINNPNYTGCGGSCRYLSYRYSYYDLQSNANVKDFAKKVLESEKYGVVNRHSDGCHSSMSLDKTLTNKFKDLNINFTALYNELEVIDYGIERD